MKNRDAHDLMTEGPIGRKMFRFAIPLFIGNLFQQLYNTADALIVGNILGNDALASVTATGSLVFLLVSFFGGISAGAGVAISRYFGAGEPDKLSTAVHTNVAFNLSAGVFLTVFGTFMAPKILLWMGTPEDVMDGAVKYIRIYFEGSLGLVMYNSTRSIMQAVGDSKNPLKYLIISSVLNIILDILFVGPMHMGIGGAAFATVLAQLVSAFLCVFRLASASEAYRLCFGKIGFNGPMLKLIVKYGLPSGIQNSVIAFANVVVQSNINAFGKMAVAGCGAYTKIEGFAFLPITCFTIAITTFVGQNLGAGQYERARKGARFGIVVSLLLAETIGFAVYVTAPYLIGFFTREPEAIAFGVGKGRICSIFFFLLAATHCIAAVLRGAGKAVVPMVIMLSFWCVVRVAFLKIMVPVYNSINVVNWVYPLTWFLSTVVLLIYYKKANWLYAFTRDGGD